MFKKIVLLPLSLIAAMFIVSCGSAPEPKPTPVAECTFPDDGRTAAPLWVCDAPVEGVKVSAVGSGEPTKAGYDFQRKMAEASARETVQHVHRRDGFLPRYAYVHVACGVDREEAHVAALLGGDDPVGAECTFPHARPGFFHHEIAAGRSHRLNAVAQEVHPAIFAEAPERLA